MNEPHKCPECSRMFAWGLDADSAIVEAQGERWLSCRENAHWKLYFHHAIRHPNAGFQCARRSESVMDCASAYPDHDWWDERDGHKACSCCGSLSPDEFFAAIEAGHELGPTDKNYKVYVHLPHACVGETVQIGSESGPAYDRAGNPNKPDLTMAEKLAGRYDRPFYGKASATTTAKFYFQHLDDAQKKRFIDLLNGGKVNIGMPGYFYRRPFFIARPKPQL